MKLIDPSSSAAATSTSLFLTLQDNTGNLIQSPEGDDVTDETVPDIDPESLIGYGFIHKIDDNGVQ